MYDNLTIRTIDESAAVIEMQITPRQALELVSGRQIACVGGDGERVKVVAKPDGTFRRGKNHVEISVPPGLVADPHAPRSAS